MRSLLLRRSAEFQRTASIVSIVVAIGSACLSFPAYLEFVIEAGRPMWVSTALAGVMAGACGAILHLNFLLIVDGVPLLDRMARQRKIPLIGGMMLMTAAFSTYTNAITSAGSEALRIHAARMIDEFSSVIPSIQAVALQAGQAAPDLERRAARFLADADCEATRGCKTGSAGAGDLTRALAAGGIKVSEIAKAIATAQATISDLVPVMNAALARGDDIDMRSQIANMRSALPLTLLRSAAADLRVDLGIRGAAKNADLRKRQDEAIMQLQTELSATADTLEGFAVALEKRIDAITLPDRRTLTKGGAILAYIDQLIPQLAIAIAIDWFLVFAAFFMGRFNDDVPPPDDDVSDISLADARRISREFRKLAADVTFAEVMEMYMKEVEEKKTIH